MAKRATRPVKPKVTAQPAVQTPTPALTPAPVVVEAPAANFVAVVPTPTPETTTQTVQTEQTPQPQATSKRQQTSKTLGVSISSARVRRHIDRLNLNFKVDSEISELKDKLAQHKNAKDSLTSGTVSYVEERQEGDKKVFDTKTRPITEEERVSFTATMNKLSADVPVMEMKVAALSRERTRFSNEASIALSIICDELIQQIIGHTMNRVLAAKKKIIQVCHLHEPGVEKLSLYPLIKNLPSFVSMAEKLTEEARSEKAAKELAAALAQAEKDFKKKFAAHIPKKKMTVEAAAALQAQLLAQVAAEAAAQAAVVAPAAPEPVPSPVQVPEQEEPADDDDTVDSKTSFKFYVGQVCKDMKEKDARYKSVRVSTDIRSYLSDLLVEFIQRISSLVHLTAACMKNKTINEVAIVRTVQGLLIDGHTSVETIEYKDAMVHDPVKLSEETAKRDEAKKECREYKIDLDKIQKVPGLVAVRTITYPTSGFAQLQAKVDEKLALHKSLMSKDKENKTKESEAKTSA